MINNSLVRRKNLIGRRFGRYLVIKEAEGAYRHVAYWLCKCDCGNERVVRAGNLLRGNTLSCGCFRDDKNRIRMTKHGATTRTKKSPEYQAWKNMKARCLNNNWPTFEYWGGRGIEICDRWLGENGFVNFLADMGYRPSPKHSLDRIDNDGNYEPSNCRWTIEAVQKRNTRRNKRIEYNGKKYILKDLAIEFGIDDRRLGE